MGRQCRVDFYGICVSVSAGNPIDRAGEEVTWEVISYLEQYRKGDFNRRVYRGRKNKGVQR